MDAKFESEMIDLLEKQCSELGSQLEHQNV